MFFQQSAWLSDSLYDIIFTAPSGDYNIFEAWILSSPPLPSRQANRANSCWMNFAFVGEASLQVQDIWKDG